MFKKLKRHQQLRRSDAKTSSPLSSLQALDTTLPLDPRVSFYKAATTPQVTQSLKGWQMLHYFFKWEITMQT